MADYVVAGAGAVVLRGLRVFGFAGASSPLARLKPWHMAANCLRSSPVMFAYRSNARSTGVLVGRGMWLLSSRTQRLKLVVFDVVAVQRALYAEYLLVITGVGRGEIREVR